MGCTLETMLAPVMDGAAGVRASGSWSGANAGDAAAVRSATEGRFKIEPNTGVGA